MNVKTIALSGAEMAVTVGGSHAEVKNNGTDIIYASANSGIVAGADGVVSISAGSAVTVLDTRGTVYLLGTGGAEIVGKDVVSQVFKPAATSGGGTTEDEVARNAISTHSGNAEIHVTARDKEKWNMSVAFVNTHISNSKIHTTAEEKAAWNAKADLSDIPTSLPANGGNAYTLGGKSAADFVQKSGDTMQGAFGMGLNQLWFGDVVYMQANGDTLYICDSTGNVIGTASKQGLVSKNSEMLENHTASDFVLKTDYDALAARVAALEGK